MSSDLPQRREEYIRLFMRADIVYVSPLTRAVQTALAAMCGHQALTKNKLTLYRYVLIWFVYTLWNFGAFGTTGLDQFNIAWPLHIVTSFADSTAY
jgi:hypothetical protein